MQPDNHRSPRSLGRRFGDLKVRPKLIILHNSFFLILACGVYFSLVPLVDARAGSARVRENILLRQIFTDDRPLPSLPGGALYEFREGAADELEVPVDIRRWLRDHPGQIAAASTGALYYHLPSSGLYRSMRSPDHLYRETVDRTQRTLFIVLGCIYCLAVLTLEFIIMPLYVYQPIRMMLRADRATQQGDRANELIREPDILDDEIGQIMRSRNATVTELRQHEDNLEQALKKLEDQDRLASIGMLSASVAHEVNTPLTVLHGSIEKLMETPHDAHTRERLARMLRVTQRLKRISEVLVDFARARKQTVESVDLRPLIDEAWSLLAIDDKASAIKFENRVEEQHCVTGNTDRLLQVFVNLLRNALNAVHVNGTITVDARRVEDAGRRWIAIDFEDNGPGIPPDVLPDIFDAFVTTRLDSKGTGLGLTVSEGIVRQHGGSITASNRRGGGARLQVKLPHG